MDTVKIHMTTRVGEEEFSLVWDTGVTPDGFSDWQTGAALSSEMHKHLDNLFALRLEMIRRLSALQGRNDDNLMPAPTSITRHTPPPPPPPAKTNQVQAAEPAAAAENSKEATVEQSADMAGWHLVREIVDEGHYVRLLTDKAPKWGVNMYKDNPLWATVKAYGFGPLVVEGRVYLNGEPRLEVEVYRSKGGGLRPRQVRGSIAK